MARRLVYSPEAQTDLLELYEYIADRSGPVHAIGYINRIERHCLGLASLGERGTKRDDIRPGLRIIGFERRVTIAFHLAPGMVTIDRIFYGGRDVYRALGEDN